MAPPKNRLVINKDAALTTEPIPKKTKKETVLTKSRSKSEILHKLQHSGQKKTRQTRRQKERKMNRPIKFFKSKDSMFRFRTLESLVKNSQSKLKHIERKRIRCKNKKNFIALRKRLINSPVLLIVRIHGHKNVPEDILTKLSDMLLFNPFQCILVRNTPELMDQLVEIQPFLTFGIPSVEVIRELVTKRGLLLNVSDMTRSMITSNVVVEKALGNWDCICIEDVVQVLQSNPYDTPINETTKKPNPIRVDDDLMKFNENSEKVKRFDAVCQAVNPFQLNFFKIPIRGLRTPFGKKGYWGDRGTQINKFVEKLI